MKRKLTLTVNGRPAELEVKPGSRLLTDDFKQTRARRFHSFETFGPDVECA